MEIEYIGPIDGYEKGKHFISIWIEIAGLHGKDKDGYSRRENAEFLGEGNKVYLFWQKDNKHDKNAVAVFADEEFNFHIGYIPREYSKDCVDAFKKGYIRIEAEVKRIYYKTKRTSDGEYEETDKIDYIKFVLDEYVNKTRALENDIYGYLNICKKIPKNILDSLKEACLLDYSKLSNTSDKEISSVQGVGRTSLKKIKEACVEYKLLRRV